jgi:hypothetical protein
MSSGTSTVAAPPAASRHEPPCPHQLSEDAISSFNLELPYLDESSLNPEFAVSAASLRQQFACASREAQSLMRSMRNAWLQWYIFPVASPGIESWHLFNQIVHIYSLTLFLTRHRPHLLPLPFKASSIAFDPDTICSDPASSRGASPPITSPPLEHTNSLTRAAARRDCARMQAVFERHSDLAGGLSQSALMAALIEVDAPVLLSSEGASADLMFRRADASARGAVDLNECEMPIHTILNLLR